MATAVQQVCAPPAGVSSVGRAAENVTTEFLQSSHFTIGQDQRYRSKGTLSTFKKDYPPWDIRSKPLGHKPPKPSELMHKDDDRIYERTSETRQQYEKKDLAKPVLQSAHEELYGTNFKMERDPRLTNYISTNNAYYTPKPLSATQPAPQKGMASAIPNGDQEKAPLPVSDYRDRFQGHDPSRNKVEKAVNQHLTGKPTILGDQRQHVYLTTHQDEFHSKFLPPIKPFSAPTGSNIPMGDAEKEGPGQTEFQTEYIPADPSQLKPYDKNAVMKGLQATHFTQHDGRSTFNHYITEMRDNYIPKDAKPAETALQGYRNKSAFPDGDWDSWRNSYRSNMTTNKYYHGKIPEYGKPEVISGADRRTKSEVQFGDPEENQKYYRTTNQDTYKPAHVPYTYDRKKAYKPSVVPLDYYKGEAHNTEHFERFQDPGKTTLDVNPAALDNLKAAHIHPPLGKNMYFLTTNQETYTPKEAKRGTYDPTRLQRSNVPLGSVNTNYFTDACD